MNFLWNSGGSKVWGLAESSTSLGGKKGNNTPFSCIKSSEKTVCSNIQTPACSVEFWELYQCIPCHRFTSCSWEIDGSHCVVETHVDIPVLSRTSGFMNTIPSPWGKYILLWLHRTTTSTSLNPYCKSISCIKKKRDFKLPFRTNNAVVNRMRCNWCQVQDCNTWDDTEWHG